ncbi:GtrA family protein [Nocardioides sp. SYSU D00065]|uniref:GtrA family protein n=1 Tax=Nocardioides sp. SYSU D00065 TaxID=2817378 RepID=UPI001B31D4F0|nr:GtrA family protein [Nocardioides sp. SYSU D00065]
MSSTAARFALVGVVNTAIDLVLFAVLSTAGCGLLLANTVSTSAGMAFSFAANRAFSFRSTASVRSTLGPFLAVTLVGLWVLHPLVIWAAAAVLGGLGVPAVPALLLGKVAAVAVGLVWNYTWYGRVVFAEREAAR